MTTTAGRMYGVNFRSIRSNTLNGKCIGKFPGRIKVMANHLSGTDD